MNTSGLAQQLAEMAVAEMESPATAEEQAASVQTMNNRPGSNATTQTTTNNTAGGRTTPIRPRPMHMPPHEIRSSPLASEPKFSYEEDRSSSFLHEEAFHNRRASGSHHGGSGSGEGPSFHSASLSHSHSHNSNRNATGRLGSSSHHNSSHSLNNNSSSHGRGHSHSPAAASSLEKQKRLKTKSKQQSMVRRMKWEAQSGSADADAYYGNGSRHTDNDEEYVFTDDPQHPQYHVDSSLEVSLDLENDNHNRRHTSIGSDDSFSPSTFQKMERQQQQNRVSPSADVSHRGMSKRRRVNLLIDQCETVRFPFKKKLILSNMDLVPHDLPLEDLNALGPTLVKLSLARNRLMAIPDTIVLRLTGLRTLDLSQCELCTLPPKWNLPHLRRLNLSHNRLTEFPDEVVLEGIPELQHLDMYGNRVCEIIVPRSQPQQIYPTSPSSSHGKGSPSLLSKLEYLDLGYNNLSYLPDDLALACTSLRTLKVTNNVLALIPQSVCEMHSLSALDVSSNPLMQPPMETCERGIASMRRYYACLQLEKVSKQRMMDDLKKRQQRQLKHEKCKEQWIQKRNQSKAKLQKHKESIRRQFFPSRHSSIASKLATTHHDDRPATADMMRHSSVGSSVATSTSNSSSQSQIDTSVTPILPMHPSSKLPSKPSTEEKEEVDAVTPKEVSIHAQSHNLDTSTPTATNTYTTVIEDKEKDLDLEESVIVDTDNTHNNETKEHGLDEKAVSLLRSSIEISSFYSNEVTEDSDATGSDVGEETMMMVHHEKYDQKSKMDTNLEMSTTTTEPETEPETTTASTEDEASSPEKEADVTVNDTLKVIFVGMAFAGKTSMIKRLLHGKDAKIPKQDERTVGVDIYEWDPTQETHTNTSTYTNTNADTKHTIDTRIQMEDEILSARTNGEVDVKFSVWDFAGQHVYHATHELFFSPRSLYVLVWDMGATNPETHRKRKSADDNQGAFKLSYDSSDDEDDDFADEELQRADRALERDIDEKVQFWVDCIQSSCPGAAILPVVSFDDYFSSLDGFGPDEAIRRCNMLKERLQKHEQRRVTGLQSRFQEYYTDNRANTENALRLRKLLAPSSRPKLIFGHGTMDSVVRVSCTKYSGFDRLAKKIVDIATGRERGSLGYPFFRGHVGARIPRMRLEVRDVVRNMRDRFKVVEWGFFLQTLKELGIDSAEDVSDALHFLTNIGELSYFGAYAVDKGVMAHDKRRDSFKSHISSDDSDDDDHDDSDQNTTSTQPSTVTCEGLSQYVFLNPRWLVAAVACILRHDLSREISETRRSLNMPVSTHVEGKTVVRGESFSDPNTNYPVITAEDACLLWQAKKVTKKAAERAQEYSNDAALTPFEFLHQLLIQFGVFVPIDLSIDKALLGGREYALCHIPKTPEFIEIDKMELNEKSPNFFFLPSLLGPGEPSEAWTYKNTDAWKTTLCHSTLFPDGVPPGMVERIMSAVLSDVHSVINDGRSGSVWKMLQDRNHSALPIKHCSRPEGDIRVKEILCWRTAFLLKFGMQVKGDDGDLKESTVEIFLTLLDRESPLCVASDSMRVGMRRLILSGKGQIGDGGIKIWQGGYALVVKAILRVMNEYGGLEFEQQPICPTCLAKKPVSQASAWDLSIVKQAAMNGDATVRCHHGHLVDIRLVLGIPPPQPSGPAVEDKYKILDQPTDREQSVPVTDILRGVVVVGLWDAKTQTVMRVGSGFIVDRKRGLIVTAAHTLMNIWNKNEPFGENYYGLRDGKVVIGVIPRQSSGANKLDGTQAVFRYFAKIAAKDEDIEANGVCHLDACVLRITTRMENDVQGNGEDCGYQPETLLLNDPDAMKKEKLHQLKVTDKCELDEQVRILGYNQGGSTLVEPGQQINRFVDFARGYVCMIFATDENAILNQFKPKEEIVIICPTIAGHSGGPVVNQQGEVIGILSRADPTERQRCYLVPASAWRLLVKKAKRAS